MKTEVRKRYTSEEKVIILKEHLLEKKVISDLCDKYNIHPSLFYRWQNDLFSKGAYAMDNGRKREESEQKKKILELEAKITIKNEVLSELMEEHIKLKKKNGEN